MDGTPHVSVQAAELPLGSEEEQPELAAAEEVGARSDGPPDESCAGPLNSQHGRDASPRIAPTTKPRDFGLPEPRLRQP